MTHDARPVIYCSGGLFSPVELRAMSRLAHGLENAGYDTFLPQRDGLEAYVLNAANRRYANLWIGRPLKRCIEKAIFALDVYQIVERCAAVVVNLNGRVPDEGMVVEMAVARAAGKPIVALHGDERWLAPPLRLVPYCIVSSDNEVPDAIRQVLVEPPAPPTTGARLAADVRRGARIWRFLGLFRGWRPANTLLKAG